MAMGRRKREEQGMFWVATGDLPQSGGHPFYEQLNKILDQEGFDAFAEERCRSFYAEKMGRPSLPPAVYFRMLLIGYFEEIDSERGIAWRVADSLALRRFLGYGLTDQTADQGDTTTLEQTIQQVDANLVAVMKDEEACEKLSEQVLREVVADKGYHSNEVLTTQREREIRTYVSEPDRGRRDWRGKEEERNAVYANRRRIRGERGRALMRRRGELVERSFAHCYDTGGMRRTHLREHPNILKRLLIHVAGFNLSLILRGLLGLGTARGLQGLAPRLAAFILTLWRVLQTEIDRRRPVTPGILGSQALARCAA